MPPPSAGQAGAPQPPAQQPPQQQGSWQSPPPGQPPQSQQPPVAAGPAPGVAYADTVSRVIALVIDAIILGVGLAVVNTFLLVIGGWGAFIITGILYIIVNAVYFIFTWTRLRASPGQKVLNLETVNAADGATVTQDQAIRRWLYLWGPASLAQILSFSGGLVLGVLGVFVSLFALAYEIYLLYSVTQSPKRQGYHDVKAGTVVIKRTA
jgi:uncharacterized RDD family membrane protein YckC